VFVATKGGLERPNGDWTTNASPSHLVEACEASLRALGVDTIGLYQLHSPDDKVPFVDSIGALRELRDAGKVQHVGLSNVSLEQIRLAEEIVPIVSVQNRCNILERDALINGVVAHCQANDIAFLPYCPVGGRRRKDEVANHPVLEAIAGSLGWSNFELALTWLLCSSPCVVPIPGASKPASALSSASVAGRTLSDEHMAELLEAFPV